MSGQYKVVFSGEVEEGASIVEAKEIIKNDFQLNDEQIDKLFVGRPIVIKKGISYEKAQKFKSVFDKAGAISQISEIKVSEQKIAAGDTPGPSGSQPAESSTMPSETKRVMVSSDEEEITSTDEPVEQTSYESQKVSCAECGKNYPINNMLRYKDSWVCATCKPILTQKLKEGVSLVSEMEYGSFWIRAGAKFIDGIILWVLQMIVGLIASPLTLHATNDPEDIQKLMAVNIVVWLVQTAIGIAYATIFIGKYAATPGKMACKLKVVTPDGGKVSYLRAFGRYWGEVLSAIIFGIGYLMAAFDEERRTLHDRICSTRVIRK